MYLFLLSFVFFVLVPTSTNRGSWLFIYLVILLLIFIGRPFVFHNIIIIMNKLCNYTVKTQQSIFLAVLPSTRSPFVDFSWNVMAHVDAREGKWRGQLANAVGSQYPSHYLGTWCIQHYYRWYARLGCQQSTELTPTGRFKWTRPFRPKDEIWFLRVCHHISARLNVVCRDVLSLLELV